MANNWTKQQKLAIDLDYGNILVSASAGSGKTAVLVERVISKVIKCHIDIDKILVVTFTNAAASELKEKLVHAIQNEIKKDTNNIFLKRQLEYINRATITTIHSFCLEVIKSNFFKLGIDPSVQICDDINSKLLKSKAMITVLENEYSKHDDNTFGLYNVLNLFSSKDEEFITALNKIYSYISSFEYPFEWFKEKIEKYNVTNFEEDLCSLDFGIDIYNSAISDLKILVFKLKDLREKVSYYEEFVKHTQMLDDDILNIERCINCSYNLWDKLYENLSLINFKSMPRTKVTNEDLKEEISNFRKTVLKYEVEKIRRNVYTNSKNILTDLKDSYKYLEYIYNFLVKFDNEYSKLKKENNYIDFSDIEHLALEVLTYKKIDENSNITYTSSTEAKKYIDKFKEIYTDEYQDTSFIQEAILNSISNGNNRFMVGDIKQSIYKFRQAMPEIFNNKYLKYDLCESLDNVNNTPLENYNVNNKIILSKNFRSRKQVINSINYIFTQIMSLEFGDCNYLGNEVLKFGATKFPLNDNADYSFEINILDNKDVEYNENIDENSSGEKDNTTYEKDDINETLEYINELKSYEIEAKYIASRIKELTITNPFKVYDSSLSTFRNAKYSDIVVLLRNLKGKGDILLNEFKLQNIPAFSDNEVNLFDNDEVRLVLSFLKVIDNPYQDIDLVACMYSIIGKFTLDEIYNIKEINKKEYMYNCLKLYLDNYTYEENNETSKVNGNNIKTIYDKDTLDKVKYFLNLIDTFREYTLSYKVAEILSRIYKETSLYTSVILLNKGQESKINLDSLVAVAEKMSNLSIYSYITYVETLKDKMIGDSTQAKIIGENENVVRIMTVHKSKGLEFPIVILSDTSSKYNTKDLNNIITLNHNLGVGINVISENTFVTYPSVIKEAIKNAEIRAIKSEELRMLYVALTRAKEKLIVYGTIKNYDKKMKDMYIIYNDHKIDSSVCFKNNSFLDNILMGINRYLKFSKLNSNSLYTFNVINVKEKDNFSNIISDGVEQNKINDKLSLEYLNKSEIEKEIIDKSSKILYDNISFEYPYKDEVSISSKVSVSELKKNKVTEEDIVNINKNLNMGENIIGSSIEKLKKPACITDENLKYNSARKGTLVHFILEHLDFKNIKSKDDILNFVNSLLEKNIIDKEAKKQINISKIYEFINSKIGKQIILSNNVKREVEFTLKDKTISKSIIQGVIDLYYLNPDNTYTLVDFKTDNLSSYSEYISRYKFQLDIYKKAIENITNVKVSNVYIYSFKLGTEIEIK